ncbi:MAG: hypothetical protein HYT89_06055 [Candidatus Omnitrophica bacterium]|nr:hypothetical protein [Candidatus Omnitrophota bacterium]
MKIVISGAPEKEVVRHILSLAKLFEARKSGDLFRIAGPAPCLLSKEKGNYHWNLYLKTKSAEEIRPLIVEVLSGFKKTKVRLTVDVDPQ